MSLSSAAFEVMVVIRFLCVLGVPGFRILGPKGTDRVCQGLHRSLGGFGAQCTEVRGAREYT